MESSVNWKHPDIKATSLPDRMIAGDLLVAPNGICNLLVFVQVDPDNYSRYNETGFGCLTAYLYDDNGNFQGSFTHQCVPGNVFRVYGQHGFNCGC